MRVFITGIAGTLGTQLAKAFVEWGFEVAGNDVKRLEETELMDMPVHYIWKSSLDLSWEDIPWYPDIVIDTAIGFADRPIANASPSTTAVNNVLTAVRLLELIRTYYPNTLVVYPSSLNSVYGWQYVGWKKATDVFKLLGFLPPLPTSVYGWSKASVELLYIAYSLMYGLRVAVVRVGSSYGPGGRLDELPHKLMLYSIKGQPFKLRSPSAARLWTYIKDAIGFYREFVNRVYEYEYGKPVILTNAGNAGCRDTSWPNCVVTNVELAEMIREIAKQFGRDLKYEPVDYYEPGERTESSLDSSYIGKPITIDLPIEQMQPPWWKPVYTLYDGLKETYAEFMKRFSR